MRQLRQRSSDNSCVQGWHRNAALQDHPALLFCSVPTGHAGAAGGGVGMAAPVAAASTGVAAAGAGRQRRRSSGAAGRSGARASLHGGACN